MLQGGFHLIARRVLSLGLGLGGMVLLTRLIGPANYGLYVGSLAIMLFLSEVARMGVDVYLVRREDAPPESVYHQAFSFLFLSGLSLGALGFLVTPVLVQWLWDPRFIPPLQILLLLLPVTLLSKPAVARLEWALDFHKVAGIELTGQVLHYALALVLAWRGYGVWAPVAGYALWQVWTVGAGHGLARYLPRWHWSPPLLREMLGYGLGVSSSLWIWRLRALVNPFVVGSFLGPEGVGYVALGIRMAETLSFVKNATWRLSIAALAKVQQDLPRLRRALEEAMGLQLLGLGPFLAGFALLAPWLLPFLFGDDWTPVLTIYPFIALGYLSNAVFNMHSSVLYVLQRNWSVTVFHLVHIALFAGTAWLLVDRLGLVGYGLAEVAALVSYVIVHLYVARLFDFGYGRAWPWFLAFAPPLFFPLVGLPWGLGLWAFAPAVVLFSGTARAQMKEYWSYIRRKK